jgi:hypothetical protein
VKRGDFWNYDRSTGLVERVVEEDGYLNFYVQSEMQPFLDRVAEARNTNAASKGLMDNGKEMHLYAILDPITILQMRAKGIDIYSADKDMQRRMFDEINANYPLTKVTTKTHR